MQREREKQERHGALVSATKTVNKIPYPGRIKIKKKILHQN